MLVRKEFSDRILIMEDKKKYFFLVLKTVGIFVSVVLIAFSIVHFIGAYYLAKPVHELKKAVPINVKADVSKPGVCSGTIEHSEHEEYANFGVILYLKHESELTFPEIFDEIEGKIETFDGHGKLVTHFDLHTESPPHRLGTDDIKGYSPCWILSPFTSEQKTIKITVTKPVEKLANTQQVFEGYYLLNGMEFLPSGLVNIQGLIFLGIGLLIGLVIILVPIYNKRRHNQEMENS